MSVNNRKWTTFTAAISLACFCVSLSACSYSTKPDASVGMSSQEESGNSENASSQEQPDNSEKAGGQVEADGSASADGAEEKSEGILSWAQGMLEGESVESSAGKEFRQDKVLQLGETASLGFPTVDNPKRIGAECTVNAAKLYNNPKEAGLDEKKVLTDAGDLLYDIETEIPVSPLDTSKLSFLLCDVSIKNISLDLGELNITMLNVAGLTSDGKELRHTGLPAYYSEAVHEISDRHFYDFDIPAGQSVDIKIGWWIDLEQYKKENLYVIYNFGGDYGLQSLWKLDL